MVNVHTLIDFALNRGISFVLAESLDDVPLIRLFARYSTNFDSTASLSLTSSLTVPRKLYVAYRVST